MQLSLPIPTDWSVQRRSGMRVAIVPGADKPDLLLAYGPLIILPDDQRSWVRDTMRFEAGGARVEITGDTTVKTGTGWPVRLVTAKVHGAEQGSVAEWRLGAFYAFFEHGATALVRATSETRYEAFLEQLTTILRGAVPDWGGEVAALSQLWDLDPSSQTKPAAKAEPLLQQAVDAGTDEAALTAALQRVDAAIAEGATAHLQCVRGRVLAAQGAREPALEAYQRAIELDASSAEAHRGAGLVLAELGRDDEAIAAWTAAADADEEDVDALFNLGQLHFNRGELGDSLAAWERALARKPGDFWTLRKIVQAHHGLDQHEQAAKARAQLVDAWASSADPQVRLADEFVFAQFEVAGVTIYGFETLRPTSPNAHDVLSFRAVFSDRSAPPLRVQVETSTYARERGTPFVLSILDGTNYQVVGTTAQIPPYEELHDTVCKLLGEALARRSN